MMQGSGAESLGFEVILNIVTFRDYRQTLGQMYDTNVWPKGILKKNCSFKCDLARCGSTQH